MRKKLSDKNKRKYDFAGWVTKNDIRCSDGRTIKKDAFKHNDQQKVPLVWNHGHDEVSNTLGHVILHNKDMGVYGYGYFNDSENGQHAKHLVQHGDISHMSIFARRIKQAANDVVHGTIVEVSLVLSAANPGALIETIAHSDNGEEEEAIIHTNTLIHSGDDVLHEDGGDTVADGEETVGQVLDTLNEKQMDAVQMLLANALSESEKDSKDDDKDEKKDEEKKEEVKHNDGGNDDVKHNVFNSSEGATGGTTIAHGKVDNLIADAARDKVSSLQDYLQEGLRDELAHADQEYGIRNIESLFPEAQNLNKEPHIYRDPNTSYKKILNAVHKSPFSRIKTVTADFTEEEARARGYIKGNEKIEQVFEVMSRVTTPQTVYKKQRLDRDDIIDITDFNVVRFINTEMRFMLEEEVARAVLVGDGREISSPDKIKTAHIRPVIADEEFYTLKRDYEDAADFMETLIRSMPDYYGSGAPSLYMDPALLADLRLLKGTDNRFLFGEIPSKEAVAARLGVKEIVDTSFMAGQGAILVNLSDYSLGASKGGEITTFEDFDIDFNQHKYLIETRLSGALTVPHAAIHFEKAVTP